jgi:APA family basic amino acid/polyamine antiporter
VNTEQTKDGASATPVHAGTDVRGRELARTIGFWGASAVMAGIIIGSGIFQTPTDIAQLLGDPWVILSLWAFGGVLSLAGALTYSELICMYPKSGGVYVFLREGYGPCMAFVFGWTYMLITKPAAAAGIAIVFATYLRSLLGVDWDPRIITTVILTLLTAINARGVALGTGIAMVLTTFKILALVGIIVAAGMFRTGDSANFVSAPTDISFWMALAPVMYLIMWTYDGWSDVGSIAGEVKEPQRNLPKIYLTGTAVITVLYLAINAVYMWMIPLEQMRTIEDVAPRVADLLVGGAAAGVVVSVIVLISTIGSTHGSIMTGARISYAQARDGLLFRFLGNVHPRYETPWASLWAQLALSITAVWVLGEFKEMVSSFSFTMWIFYGLSGAVIFIMRRRRPDAERAFRCPGYPFIPGLFVLAAIGMTAMSIYNSPRTTLPWIGVLLAGIPVYYVWSKFFKAGARPTPSES